MEGLQVAWYLIIIFSLISYSILDGFDLGVGALHLFAKKDVHRRLFLNAIGPVWDGNEVWLVIVGGALFAGFPDVYATIFSAFYVPCMAFLCALISRAVAIECRSKLQSRRWRSVWDIIFSAASIVISFCVGFVLVNLIRGIPINREGIWVGSFWDFFAPYTLLGGITLTALFMAHGNLYLLMKTEHTLYELLRALARYTLPFFIVCYILLVCTSLVSYPSMIHRVKFYLPLIILPFIAPLLMVAAHFLVKSRKDGWGFVCSCLTITTLFVLLGVESFPTMVRSSIDPEQFSLTLFNTETSKLTLKILLVIVCVGVPLVLAYGCYVYYVFRGKVKLDSKNGY